MKMQKKSRALDRWVRHFVIGLLTLSATLTAKAGEQLYYYHTDHLGTPQVMTDSQGQVVWKGHYRPFGEVEVVVEGVVNNLRFPGQYFDEETGNYYNYFRDYDPATGRYMQSDPIGLSGGLNTYAYVNGNPTGFVDPFGLRGPGVIIIPAPVITNPGAPGGTSSGDPRNGFPCSGSWIYGKCYPSMGEQIDVSDLPDAANDPSYDEQCKGPSYDNDEIDCDEWRVLLQLQRNSILADFLRGAISITGYNELVIEHNQAVEFYKIECADTSADELKL